MKPNIPPVLIIFALVCFGLVQNAQAVSPAPDGGYPGGNTAEGSGALGNLTTDIQNTALGYQTRVSLPSGSHNTATGFQTLLNNTTGSFSVATGAQALF